MMNASAVFRRFDMNRSGMMEYNEWMMAMSALGYMMNPMDAPRLFAMIDRDRSGRISEREFVEYWSQYGW
jgi:Ca2+-binding EF-hand superfamily protein